jgi:hypothetical protein
MRKCKSGNFFCADAKKKGNESVGSFYLNFSFFFLNLNNRFCMKTVLLKKTTFLLNTIIFLTINIGLGYPLVESISCLKIEW